MKALTASLLVALASCGPAVNQNDNTRAAPGTFLITAEQIEKSGAHTAWQVLKQHAPMLTMREDRNGRPVSIGRHGRASFLLDEAPIVLLDGVRVPDFHSLDTIDAQSIFAASSAARSSAPRSRKPWSGRWAAESRSKVGLTSALSATFRPRCSRFSC